jgi:hypothetical protein
VKATKRKRQTPPAVIARRAVKAAYPTDEAERMAAAGTWLANGVLDAVMDISIETDTLLIHPDILPSALPVIIREGRAYLRDFGEKYPGSAKAIRNALRKIEGAAKNKG